MPKPKTVAIFGPKGGIGKTTITTSLMVAAARTGLSVLGVDADPQRSLSLWHKDRMESPMLDRLVNVDIVVADLKRFSSVISESSHDVVIFDTGPSMEGREATISMFVEEMDFVLMPIQQTDLDRKALIPWMKQIQAHARHSEFVINRAIHARRSYRETKQVCIGMGVAPVDVPFYEDIPKLMSEGYSVAEVTDSMGHTETNMLWSHIARVVKPVRKAA
jgi:chromosome partitioning protein